jgi:hypothetical protein
MQVEALQKSLATKTRLLNDLRKTSELKILALQKSLATRDKIISKLKKQVEELEAENEFLFKENNELNKDG